MHSPCVTELRNECSICGGCEGVLVLCVIAPHAVVWCRLKCVHRNKYHIFLFFNQIKFQQRQEVNFEIWGYFHYINDVMCLFIDPHWHDAQEGSWEGPGAGQEDWGSPQEEWSAYEEVQGKDKCSQAKKLLWSPGPVLSLWKPAALSGSLINLLFSLSCI